MLLNETLQMKAASGVLFAGQICGVEGYVESIATGLMAGIHAAALVAARLRLRRRGNRHSDRWCTTSRMPMRKTFSRRTLRLICLPPLEKKVRDRQ